MFLQIKINIKIIQLQKAMKNDCVVCGLPSNKKEEEFPCKLRVIF